MLVFKYNSEEERQQLIDEHTGNGLLFVQEANITEGDFLYFAENPIPPKTPIEQEVAELKSQNSEIILTLVMNNLM